MILNADYYVIFFLKSGNYNYPSVVMAYEH